MKVTLRKIAVLVLTLVLVCLFSASAFAATSFSDLKMYDDGETYVDVYASINSTSSSGTLSLTAVGLQSNTLEIDVLYVFDDSDGDEHRERKVVTETVWSSCTASTGGYDVDVMTSATYIFEANFSSWIGENNYASTSGTLKP